MSAIAHLRTTWKCCHMHISTQTTTTSCFQAVLTTGRTWLALVCVTITVVGCRTLVFTLTRNLKTKIWRNTILHTIRWKVIGKIPYGELWTTFYAFTIEHVKVRLASCTIQGSNTRETTLWTFLTRVISQVLEVTKLTTCLAFLSCSVSEVGEGTIYI